MLFSSFQVMMSKMFNINLFSKRKRYGHINRIDFDSFRSFQYSGSDRDIYLTPTGWKILIDKVLSPVIEKELGMTYLGNGYWADSFNNHRRRVLSLFYINNAFATFKWGWNFDFVPGKSGKRLVYARTDKCVYSHIFEMSSDFYNNTEKRKHTIIGAYGGEISHYNASMNAMCKSYVDAFYFLLPLIRDYYKKTDSYNNTLKCIEHNLENDYLKIINYDMTVARVFIEYASGNCKSALSHFEDIGFTDDDIKNKYLRALHKLDDAEKII